MLIFQSCVLILTQNGQFGIPKSWKLLKTEKNVTNDYHGPWKYPRYYVKAQLLL